MGVLDPLKVQLVNPSPKVGSQFQGIYTTAGALTTALPAANAGDYAFVSGDESYYFWDDVNSEWDQVGAGGGGGGGWDGLMTIRTIFANADLLVGDYQNIIYANGDNFTISIAEDFDAGFAVGGFCHILTRAGWHVLVDGLGSVTVNDVSIVQTANGAYNRSLFMLHRVSTNAWNVYNG